MICIIGAGIAGVSAAYFLQEAGAKPLLIDRSEYLASGGSGAAGAFISPKIGKGASLQELTNEAFAFACRFYQERFSDYYHTTGVLRIPKDLDDAKRFELYEAFNYQLYERWDARCIEEAGFKSLYSGFYFPKAGDVDAQELCRALAKGVAFKQMDVKALEYKSGEWHIISKDERLRCSHIVLATGHESSLLDLRYMGIKGLWGSRGDYASDKRFKVTVHKDISISSERQGRIKLAATHIKHPNPCMACDGRPLASLEAKASRIADTSDFRLIRTYCGMRATSKDHTPLLGPIIDVPRMLREFPAITKGAKAPLLYMPNITIFNGLGGRGFVFAPLMAKYLTEWILNAKQIDKRVHPDRLFWKWVRRYLTPNSPS